jgi:hypothetical protein
LIPRRQAGLATLHPYAGRGHGVKLLPVDHREFRRPSVPVDDQDQGTSSRSVMPRTRNAFDESTWAGLGRSWFWLASAAALLAAAGSVVGLSASGAVYGQETQFLADQAVAQDLVNLLLVAPLTVLLGWSAKQGAVRAYLVWLACLAFTV